MFYTTAQLSERISETPEGFLLCEAVPITRTGDLMYAPGETPIEPGQGQTRIHRDAEDVFTPETLASFEGKPVTLQHPQDFVTPENWRELAVGTVQNVRRGDGLDADKLLADLLITDATAIAAVKGKTLREVSCGYDAEYVQLAPGIGKQKNIIGNHVALVPAGRCGAECAIHDHAPKGYLMSMKEKIMGIFGQALDEALPDDAQTKDAETPEEAFAALEARVAALEKAAAGEKQEPAAADACGEKDAEPDSLEARLQRLEEALGELRAIAEAKAAAEMLDAGKTCDAETAARAEILAPGIGNGADVQEKALKAAYETKDGRAIIDRLLAGRAFDAADTTLFVAAAELMKEARRAALTQDAAAPKAPAGVMTPEKLNAIHAAYYAQK